MGILLLLLAVVCDCDPSSPEKMAARQCSLCREAEKQPADAGVFFLKDINPRKPGRWLALPRKHGTKHHSMADMTPAERTALWAAAIAKAKELFGDEWGLAINGDLARTQCHTHIHVGRMVPGVEIDGYVVVNSSSEIPQPADGTGLWVHPAGNQLHVHAGEQITEAVLLR